MSQLNVSTEPAVAVTALSPSRFAMIEARIDALAIDVARGISTSQAVAAELLLLGEETLEIWIEAHGQTPTQDTREGFRLLALHRQGARGEPSFNACRETARELVYHYNLVMAASAGDAPNDATGGEALMQTLRMMTLVAKHLVYFVDGKLTVEGLGEFCCAAKPIRGSEVPT